MARTCGRSPRRERLRAAIPLGHLKKTTFVAGLRHTGMVADVARQADQRNLTIIVHECEHAVTAGALWPPGQRGASDPVARRVQHGATNFTPRQSGHALRRIA